MLKAIKTIVAVFLAIFGLVFGIAIVAMWHDSAFSFGINLFGLVISSVLPLTISYFLFKWKFKSQNIKLPHISIKLSKIKFPQFSKKESNKSAAEYLLNYVDRNGQSSEREITIKKVYNLGTSDDTLYMRCFCYSAEDIRNFKIINIVRLVEIQSGEVILNPLDFIKMRYQIKKLTDKATSLPIKLNISKQIITIKQNKMNTELKKSQWKPWHKKALLVFAGFILLLFFIDESANKRTSKDPALARSELINKAFSPWNGSPIQLERLVKQNMNDAKSFEFVDCQVWDQDSFILVNMRYRGKNAFGAKVVESVRAKCGIGGDVIQIIQ